MLPNAEEPAAHADDPAPPTGEMVLYQTEDGRTRVECRFVDETLWLSQALIGELFQKDVRTVNEHLQNIYQEGEIEEQATIRKFRIVRREGPREVERISNTITSKPSWPWVIGCGRSGERSSAAGRRNA